MEYDEADLIDMLGEERALDRARLVWAAREARRASGVSWSGMTPALPAGRADDDLLEAARAKLAVRRDWRASAQGRFVVAVTEIQAAARAVQATSERAREAAARGVADEIETCDAAIRELRRQAVTVMAGVREARRALRR